MRFQDKVVFITGGGSGIGRAAALLFAAEGAERVIIVDRFADRLQQVETELKEAGTAPSTIVADLVNPSECRDAVAQAAREAGRIDVVVSNAGLSRPESFLKIPQESWAEIIDVNLNAHFHIGQAAANVMVDKGTRGVILFTVTGSAYGAFPKAAHYAAAKAGLMNLVKTMAFELGEYGIRVNSVSPGVTDTPGAVSQVGEEAFKWMRESYPCPLGRVATPEEVAKGFIYLASDDASYVTAIDLPVDSGVTQSAVSFGEIPDALVDQDVNART
jgi:NAD(P)-dependent dehydrogenase (short-subunit alcohol dehydrogenase family)